MDAEKGLNFLKEIIWLLAIGMEFAYEIIPDLQMEKDISLHPICKNSELFYNFNMSILLIVAEQ